MKITLFAPPFLSWFCYSQISFLKISSFSLSTNQTDLEQDWFREIWHLLNIKWPHQKHEIGILRISSFKFFKTVKPFCLEIMFFLFSLLPRHFFGFVAFEGGIFLFLIIFSVYFSCRKVYWYFKSGFVFRNLLSFLIISKNLLILVFLNHFYFLWVCNFIFLDCPHLI